MVLEKKTPLKNRETNQKKEGTDKFEQIKAESRR